MSPRGWAMSENSGPDKKVDHKWLGAIGLIFVIAGAGVRHGIERFSTADVLHLTRGTVNSAPASHATTQGPADFVALAKQIGPVVVNVSATQVRAKAFSGPPDDDDLLDELFGMPPLPESLRRRSTGSGFVIEHEGLILTNRHLVEGAKTIVVKLADGKEFAAKLVGQDSRTDIAIIRIDGKSNLPTAALGDSNRLEVGEWVMAVGNPFGLDNSATSGIVSAKGRHLGAGPDVDFIQTDASINPGNSGGPLVNLRGEVVGVTTAIVSQTGANVGIGFAIPINLVKELLPQLKAKGKITQR